MFFYTFSPCRPISYKLLLRASVYLAQDCLDFVVNIIKICIWLLLLSYSAVLIQGAATGKENKVKLIKDNIVFMIVIVVLMMKSDMKWLD